MVWARVRAGVIAVAILVAGVEGCPVPRASRAQLDRPLNRRELERWSGFLTAAGIERTPDALADEVVAVSQSLGAVQDTLVAPFRRWFHLTQTRQRWSLFPIADPEPYRMWVEARARDGGWRLVYRPLDDRATLLAGELEYRRLRAIWNPGSSGPRLPWSRFVDWLSAEIFRRHPEYAEVRVRVERYHVSLPGEPHDPRQSFLFEQRRVRPGEAAR